jgi:hypothetical protein
MCKQLLYVIRKFFIRDCIQSLGFGVMLAKRKKWKLASNASEALGKY